ncbi:phosphotransferase [Actinorhabdospora filicis]|uniref:Phosphotransferase n=1 Tax=Actinorhabdospora filicis TaxID=1785913 RepID=A0A9W6SKW5_9ACTN|nr:aminoglycoside phosphotransferase family protein [Actinorhabdospora filicis]GLZ77802.1 phosphotransferase [Actinorhabdospora filicis]
MTGDRVLIDGDRVRRPAGWWTPTVHDFLRHLHDVGFDRVPRPLDLADGWETLALIPGDSGAEGWGRVISDDGLRAFAALLRDFHEAARGYRPPPGAAWALDYGPGDVICHGDFGPWNAVWHGDEPVGLVDFDFAGPGDRLLDIAYALEFTAPFRSDDEAMTHLRHPVPPDRPRRIELFAEAYGMASTAGLVDAVIARQRLTITHVRQLARRGLRPQRDWVEEGYLAELEQRAVWSERHRVLLDA